MNLLDKALREVGESGIAKAIGLHPNTVKRWVEQQKFPEQYYGDLCRLIGEPIGEQTVSQKNQYFTSTEVAQDCYEKFLETAELLGVDLADYTFIEPSAGNGSFYNLLPSERRIGVDIDPQMNDIITGDYLTWEPDNGKYVVIGNPPFGLRGHLALQFINHSNKFADMVAFILPPLFNSDGKGVPGKRVNGYQLAYTSNLPPDSFYYPDGKKVSVSCIFQVWSSVGTENISIHAKSTCDDYIKIYSLSDGGTASSTRNKKMLYGCDIYLPSTCFEGMRVYDSFEELPKRRGYGIVIKRNKDEITRLLSSINWQKVAFSSSNGATNLRSSLISNVLIENGFVDKEREVIPLDKILVI